MIYNSYFFKVAVLESDMNTNNEEMLTGTSCTHSGKSSLRRFIRLALAGSVLASGMSVAALQDHGPADATLGWPQWYRDLDGLPLGLCKSQASSPNAGAGGAPMCFPIVSNPAGFAGNIGDEIFYMNLNANIANGGIDLRYVTGLEAAYGNATRTPIKGQEVVFARVRFVMGVTGASCIGAYRIIHPWGDQTFFVDQEGPRALFETLDIPRSVRCSTLKALCMALSGHSCIGMVVATKFRCPEPGRTA